MIVAGCASKNAAPAASANSASTQPLAATPVKESKKNSELNKWLAAVDVVVPPTTYRVDPPDELRIVAPAVKELNDSKVRIRSDGKITLNLLGDVYVAGLSPSEIA
jgi:protein involved in polysaccharide export with SLBB domain